MEHGNHRQRGQAIAGLTLIFIGCLDSGNKSAVATVTAHPLPRRTLPLPTPTFTALADGGESCDEVEWCHEHRLSPLRLGASSEASRISWTYITGTIHGLQPDSFSSRRSPSQNSASPSSDPSSSAPSSLWVGTPPSSARDDVTRKRKSANGEIHRISRQFRRFRVRRRVRFEFRLFLELVILFILLLSTIRTPTLLLLNFWMYSSFSRKISHFSVKHLKKNAIDEFLLRGRRKRRRVSLGTIALRVGVLLLFLYLNNFKRKKVTKREGKRVVVQRLKVVSGERSYLEIRGIITTTTRGYDNRRTRTGFC